MSSSIAMTVRPDCQIRNGMQVIPMYSPEGLPLPLVDRNPHFPTSSVPDERLSGPSRLTTGFASTPSLPHPQSLLLVQNQHLNNPETYIQNGI